VKIRRRTFQAKSDDEEQPMKELQDREELVAHFLFKKLSFPK